MRRSLPLLICALFATVMAASAQNLPENFTNYGVHGDGSIDLSGIPAPPASKPTPAVNVTLPVTGVPGLTVTVFIPATGASGAYQVEGGAIRFFAGPGQIQFTFNKQIYGLAMEAGSVGRFNRDFSLSTGPIPASSSDQQPNYSVDSRNFTFDPYTPAQVELQMRATDGQGFGFSTAYFQGSGPYATTLSNVRVQSMPGSAVDLSGLVPRDGLEQWLSASYPTKDGFGLEDRSGEGHDAALADHTRTPAFITDAINNLPALDFNGSQYLGFNLSIAGWTEMTVFLVARSNVDQNGGPYGSEDAAVFWNENHYWGNTYVSPFQTHVDFRFGTTQTGNDPNLVRPGTRGQDFTITRAMHNNNTDSLYVDGVPALRQGNKFAALNGSDGSGYLGRGYNNTYFKGQIAEVLVYNRALSGDEAARVESYLRRTYGLN